MKNGRKSQVVVCLVEIKNMNESTFMVTILTLIATTTKALQYNTGTLMTYRTIIISLIQ